MSQLSHTTYMAIRNQNLVRASDKLLQVNEKKHFIFALTLALNLNLVLIQIERQLLLLLTQIQILGRMVQNYVFFKKIPLLSLDLGQPC